MADKDKKVISIRKDVVIQEPEKHEPIPELVALTKFWYEQALSGNLKTFAFSAVVIDPQQPNFGIAGLLDYHWARMYAQMTSLVNEYYINEVLPALTGIYPEDYIDE